MAKYIREPSPFNTQIVSLGVDTYLKMLLADNFVHTDLHPGNIMVRIRGVSQLALTCHAVLCCAVLCCLALPQAHTKDVNLLLVFRTLSV